MNAEAREIFNSRSVTGATSRQSTSRFIQPTPLYKFKSMRTEGIEEESGILGTQLTLAVARAFRAAPENLFRQTLGFSAEEIRLRFINFRK